MSKVVVIGAGWAGVSAAVCAKKAGAEVTLIEKTDLILGAGNAGGIFRNNGRYTALEEMKALGAGELFDAMDKCAQHTNVEFPGHSHASLYNVNKIEPCVRKVVQDFEIELMTESHVDDAQCKDGVLLSVTLHDGTRIDGDAFVDATGSSGPMGNCLKYGNGCSMCIQRCPTFGPRVSITAKAGIKDLVGKRADGTPGVFSGACKIHKSSLSEDIRKQLDSTGVAIVKVPSEDINYDKLGQKACKQYALKEYSENIILLDTGSAKLMTSYYPLEKLRKIPGMEKAEYIDPYSAGRGNSIRYLAVAPCDDTMLAQGARNLFCGGEKGAPLIGHTEAVVTGALAGHNAVRCAKGLELVTLPESLAVGLIIAHSHNQFVNKKEYKDRFTFAGGAFFEMMKERNLYTTDVAEIQNRVEKAGLANFYEQLV
ncbi:FAD-dependent oxidoreductase [Butyrivibrio sp. AE2032]|uniref:FAD-dependent oxidoreductase n=1 Tax=Butyrivibrio sp. AE2032 TaxID=1458463 RepID=UPI0005504CD6|nr:FAD-dependent oxidoreductase [Butyrivibrio sp. AE2032]